MQKSAECCNALFLLLHRFAGCCTKKYFGIYKIVVPSKKQRQQGFQRNSYIYILDRMRHSGDSFAIQSSFR